MKIKKQTDVPRMERKQPDIVLLKTASKQLEIQKPMNRMAFVTFDHKAHENYNNTCRVCHHESMQPCVSCHTLTASLEGPVDVKGVTLERAMHTVTSDRSCQGCHEEVKKKETCAGCHILMGRRDTLKDETCMKCHAAPVAENRGPLNKMAEKRFAENVLNSRIRTTGTFEQDDIPEKITISRLSRLYEAVELPHRTIVNALVDNIRDNKLAGYFHDKKGTICQGCHHHSPVSKRPPQCGHCHGPRWDEETPAKPGIIGAYHQQCMGCHKVMNIEKPAGCTECHKMKKTG
jgi:hypothetical protein